MHNKINKFNSFQWWQKHLSPVLTEYKYWFIFINSALNPFIYGYNNQTMQKAFRITFTCFFKDKVKSILVRCLMVLTDQADPGCFYFRISWILMERRLFYFFHPLHFLQGLRSLKHWLLQKLSMKIFDQKFRFLKKK